MNAVVSPDFLKLTECQEAFMLLGTEAGLEAPGVLEAFADPPGALVNIGAAGLYWFVASGNGVVANEKVLFSLWLSTNFNAQGSDFRPYYWNGAAWIDPLQTFDENWLTNDGSADGRIVCAALGPAGGGDRVIVCAPDQRPYLLEKQGSTWTLAPLGRLKPNLGTLGILPTGRSAIAAGQVSAISIGVRGGGHSEQLLCKLVGGGGTSGLLTCAMRLDSGQASSTRILYAGSGYTNGTYLNRPVLDGPGGADMGGRVTIVAAGGVITSCTITANGTGYSKPGYVDANIGAPVNQADIRIMLAIASVSGLPAGAGYTSAPYPQFYGGGGWDTYAHGLNSATAGGLNGEYEYAFTFIDDGAESGTPYETELSAATVKVTLNYQDAEVKGIAPIARLDASSAQDWVKNRFDSDVSYRCKYVGVYRRGGASGSWRRVAKLGPHEEYQGYLKYSNTGAIADVNTWYVVMDAALDPVTLGMWICYSARYRDNKAFGDPNYDDFFMAKVTAMGAHDGVGRELTVDLPHYKSAGTAAAKVRVILCYGEYADRVLEGLFGTSNPAVEVGHEIAPPSRYVAAWQGAAWFANTGEYRGQILRSSLKHPGYTYRNETPNERSGGVELYTAEGPYAEITGLVPVGDGVLGVWTKNGHYAIYGSDATNYEVRRMSEHGCVAHNCALVFGDGAIWAGADGLKFWRPGGAVEDISGGIRPFLNGVSPDCMFVARRYLWVFVTEDLSGLGGQDGVAYVRSLDTGGWTKVWFGGGPVKCAVEAPALASYDWYAGVDSSGYASPGVVRFPGVGSHDYAYGDLSGRVVFRTITGGVDDLLKLIRAGLEVRARAGASQTVRLVIDDLDTGTQIYDSGDVAMGLVAAAMVNYKALGLSCGGRRLQATLKLPYPQSSTVVGRTQFDVVGKGVAR